MLVVAREIKQNEMDRFLWGTLYLWTDREVAKV